MSGRRADTIEKIDVSTACHHLQMSCWQGVISYTLQIFQVKKMLADEPKFEVMKLFQHFDRDNSGVISFKNLKEVLINGFHGMAEGMKK